MIFDVKAYRFTHEPSGYVLNAEELFYNEDAVIAADIYAGTGVKVDDFFIQTLRDTTESFS